VKNIRRIFFFEFICLFSILIALGQPKTIQWSNGYWFNGNNFQQKTFYSVNGLFTEKAPFHIDSTIDLGGRYVIPPYGEAHNHSPETADDINVFIERYLSDGVFYIKNPNSIPALTNKIKHRINTPSSPDVVYANGGITGSGGHPVTLYLHLQKTKYRISLQQLNHTDLEGVAYYTIDSEADLEKKWPAILVDSPAFIKVYLLYSEEYEKRKNITAWDGKKGLNPKLVKSVVKKAKQSGLTVSCHVETPTDLRHALRSGISEINHLPGYQVRWKDGYEADYYLLDEPTVKFIKKKGAHVDATYSLAETELTEPDSTRRAQRWNVQISNLRLLKKFHVPVTIGCDSYNKTARTEMEYLIKMNIYTPLELLKMWCELTPKAIFPTRNIAALKEGYEASFLILKNNPLVNASALFDIHLRVKQGHILW
jgi:hypothetical protein